MKLVRLALIFVAAQGLRAEFFGCDLPGINATISITEALRPATPRMGDGFSSGIGAGQNGFGNTAEHTLMDSSKHLYSGYDVKVERIGKADRFQVIFSALKQTPEELKLPEPSLWTMMPAPDLPAPQIVRAGDTLVFGIFENPATGQKIVDSVRIENSLPCNNDGGCLAALVDAEARTLAKRISALETAQSSQAAALESSQQFWEQYKQEACGAISNQLKHLNCKLTLIRSRLEDLKKIY